jgi:hypothetical protein
VSLSHGSALSERIIKMAIEVHRQLGPGLLESAYEACLCHELAEGGIAYARQVPQPILLINFNSLLLKDGLRRFVL